MPNYSSMLAMLRADLERFIQERDAAQEKIERIAVAIEHIEALEQELEGRVLQPPPMPYDEEQGFTERVREVLKANSAKRLTAIEVRDVLMDQTPDADHKIVLIHTHNTLKRLHQQGEVDQTKISDGRHAYQWKTHYENLMALKQIGDAILNSKPDDKLRETISRVMARKK